MIGSLKLTTSIINYIKGFREVHWMPIRRNPSNQENLTRLIKASFFSMSVGIQHREQGHGYGFVMQAFVIKKKWPSSNKNLCPWMTSYYRPLWDVHLMECHWLFGITVRMWPAIPVCHGFSRASISRFMMMNSSRKIIIRNPDVAFGSQHQRTLVARRSSGIATTRLKS